MQLSNLDRRCFLATAALSAAASKLLVHHLEQKSAAGMDRDRDLAAQLLVGAFRVPALARARTAEIDRRRPLAGHKRVPPGPEVRNQRLVQDESVIKVSATRFYALVPTAWSPAWGSVVPPLPFSAPWQGMVFSSFGKSCGKQRKLHDTLR